MKGSRSNPFELRPGADDRFYMILSDWLDDGDTIATAPFSCPSGGLTLTSENVNSAPLSLGGVSYAAGTVASVKLADMAAPGNLVEVIATVTTTSGRLDLLSMWIRGVANYGHVST